MTETSKYRSILYFDAVRRYQSVREAARRLGIAASAVNRQLLNMEEEFGMPLFERLSDGMRLTAAGEALARHSIAVLQDEKRVMSELDALRGLRRGEVSIVAAESLNSRILPEVLTRLIQDYPGIKCRMQTAGSNEIPNILKQGDTDLGLAFSIRHDSAVQRLAMRQFPLGAIVRPDHPLVRETEEGAVTLAQCLRHPVILPGPTLSVYSLLEQPLRRFDGRYQISCEVDSIDLMKNMVRRLNHVAFLSRLGLEQELGSGELVFLPLARAAYLTTELGLYAREGSMLSIASELVVNLIREKFASYDALD
jgi:DNA-binding transcriptional LysR family regulator